MQYAKYRPLIKRMRKWFARAYPAALCLAVCAAVGTASGTWLPGLSASGADVLDAVPYFRGIWVLLYLGLPYRKWQKTGYCKKDKQST